MLKIIARIVDGNRVYGYRVVPSLGGNEVDISRLEVWRFAKDKQICNVIASGTEVDMTLSGTNGFELKKLPDVKYTQPEKQERPKLTSQDILAVEIRGIISRNIPFDISVEERTRMAKEALKVECSRMTNNLSNNITILNTLSNKDVVSGEIIVDKEGKEQAYNKLGEGTKKLLSIQENLSVILKMAISDANELGLDEFCIHELPSYKGNKENLISIAKTMRELNMTDVDTQKQKEVDDIFSRTCSKTITKSEVQNLLTNLNMVEIILNTNRGLKATSPVIGYKIQYTGNEPLLINRIGTEGSKSTIELAPNSTICLNRTETALLASNMNINCRFANAKLSKGSRKQDKNILAYLSTMYILFTTTDSKGIALSAHDNKIKQTVQDNVSKEEAEKYFGIINKEKEEHRREVKNKINSASSLTGMFNAFKK